MNVLGRKYRWNLPSYDSELVLAIAKRYSLSFPIAQTLINRGYHDQEAIDSFLFSSLSKDVAHPSLMKDAQKAVDRILYAIKHKEKILVFGDYDVDGITSCALMMLCLKPLGIDINFFLPHRVRDGYGLSIPVVERASRNNYAVIITVDNGITAFEPAAHAKKHGIDLIITDHHRPQGAVPEAFAIVNPHQDDCSYPFKYFAGVGVTFKILSLLYEKLNLSMPPKAIELLLLGTVADVVPLVGENRFWVRYGLQFVNKADSYAFRVLKKNGNISKQSVTAQDVGFSIAPQINALGRLEDPRQGVKFLIGMNEQEIDQVGHVLWVLNQTRKDIERTILQEITMQIEDKKIDLSQENIIIAAHNQWSPGVIGLVASRLVGMYGKPTLLFHTTSDGKAKGSARSITEFNIFDALFSCKDLLDTFGGHSLAAGLSLPIKQVPQLKERLEKLVATTLTPDDLQQKINLDAHLSLPEVNHKIIKDMHHLEPFGHENAPPTFYIPGVTLLKEPTLLKDAHVKCTLFAEGVIKPVVFFNRPDIFNWFKEHPGEPFDLAAQVTENHWQGKVSIELRGIDIAQQPTS